MKLVSATVFALAAALISAVTAQAPTTTADIDFSALLDGESSSQAIVPSVPGVIAFDAGSGIKELRSDDADVGDNDAERDTDMDFATEHNFGDTLVRQSLIDRVNTLRADAGLAPACLSYKLHNTAQSQAYYIARTNNITVISEDGFTPSSRGRSARFSSTGVAEVIGAGYTSVDDVVAAWLTSDEAKAILLSNYTHIGPGYAVDTTQPYAYYWVVDLASGRGENCSVLAR